MAEPDWVWLYARHRERSKRVDDGQPIDVILLGISNSNTHLAAIVREIKGDYPLKHTKLVAICSEPLKAFGCTFDAVTNGQDACDALKENNYDVVLMDVQMPVMNGLDATQIIRKEINSQVPIIAVTASALWMISCPNPSMPKHLRRNYGDGGRLKKAYKRGLGFGIYDRLDEWGYGHESVNHAAGEYARDDDGDGFCEVHN